MEKFFEDIISISQKLGTGTRVANAARKAWPQVEDNI